MDGWMGGGRKECLFNESENRGIPSPVPLLFDRPLMKVRSPQFKWGDFALLCFILFRTTCFVSSLPMPSQLSHTHFDLNFPPPPPACLSWIPDTSLPSTNALTASLSIPLIYPLVSSTIKSNSLSNHSSTFSSSPTPAIVDLKYRDLVPSHFQFSTWIWNSWLYWIHSLFRKEFWLGLVSGMSFLFWMSILFKLSS